MIQVCSQCATRWNVRERRRAWCPRCHGTLLAPTDADSGAPAAAPVEPSASAAPWAPPKPQTPAPGPRLPPGYRWIAVRPGAAPRTRPPRRPLGPTPRYPYIPRWGLIDQTVALGGPRDAQLAAPRTRWVQPALIATIVLSGFAALVYAAQYGLLIVNRTQLLSPLVVIGATGLELVAAGLAVISVVVSALVLTSWLVARRSVAYRRAGHSEPRRGWALLAGCLVPLVNLLLAPVYIIELALLENRYARLRRPISIWWLTWLSSTLVSIYAFATRFADKAQGIADNTLATMIAYLVAAVAALYTLRMYRGFESHAVAAVPHHWVVVDSAEGRGAAGGTPAVDSTAVASADSGAHPDTGSGADTHLVAPVETPGRVPAA